MAFGTRRTGLPSIRNFARKMCRLVVAFTPIIRKVYPDSPALMLALEAANAACETLVQEIDAVLEPGT